MSQWNNDKIRDLVIRTIVGEAARNDRDSQISVAHVMKNRAETGHYGDRSINGLTNTIRAPKQFSMWNPDISSSGKTISPNDPYYQLVGAIADGVFSGQIPDNTGGADHYYAPSGMPGGRAPSWAIGQTPTATIGGQHFFKLGLGASDATNFGHTSAPAIGASAPAPTPAPAASGQFGPDDVYRNIPVKDDRGEDQIAKFMSWNPDPIGTEKARLAQVHPDMQAIVNKVRTDHPDLHFVVGSGLRSQADQQNAYKWGWSTVDPAKVRDVNQRGIAADLWPLDTNNRVMFDPDRQAQIAAAMKAAAQELGTPITWGGDWNTFKDRPHFQLDNPRLGYAPGAPLSSTPAAPAVNASPTPNPDAPAPQAQPVAAVAPPGSPPIPGGGQNPPAGFVGPGSDKYSVIQRMPTGTGRNPELITAANWGNLFGGANPVASPAAPAATPAPAAQPGPAYGPPLPPVTTPPNAPVNEPPGSIMSSILPNWGATTGDYNPAEHPGWAPNPHLKGALGALATTAGQPTMGFPAMTNPFGQSPPPPPPPPPAQTSSLPGSMFASAQNLLKLLYPTG